MIILNEIIYLLTLNKEIIILDNQFVIKEVKYFKHIEISLVY